MGAGDGLQKDFQVKEKSIWQRIKDNAYYCYDKMSRYAEAHHWDKKALYYYKKYGPATLGIACAGVALAGTASPLLVAGGFAYGYIAGKIAPTVSAMFTKGFDKFYNYVTKDTEPVISPKLTTVSNRQADLSELNWDKTQANKISHEFTMPVISQQVMNEINRQEPIKQVPHVNLKNLGKSQVNTRDTRDFSRTKESGNPFSGGLRKS